MSEQSDRIVSVACFGLVGDTVGRVLLVRQSDGLRLWSLPGGMALPGEALTETARREVFEETGVEVEIGDLVSVADRGSLLMFVFHATALTTHTTAQEGEVDECRWFSGVELRKLGDEAFTNAVQLGVAWSEQPRDGLRVTPLDTPVGQHLMHSAYGRSPG